jgi:hypothetical protein
MASQQPDAGVLGGQPVDRLPARGRYRKKPVEVGAIQWTGGNLAEVLMFTGPAFFGAVAAEDRDGDPDMTAEVYDKLHGTWVHVYDGQWIIRGIQGELYPCAADVFAATYEPAGEPAARIPGAEAGVALIAAERARQVAVKGYDEEHDAEHAQGEMAEMAASYALAACGEMPAAREFWPFALDGLKPFKPGPKPVDALVKAGAMCAAEIDRIVAEEALRG